MCSRRPSPERAALYDGIREDRRADVRHWYERTHASSWNLLVPPVPPDAEATKCDIRERVWGAESLRSAFAIPREAAVPLEYRVTNMCCIRVSVNAWPAEYYEGGRDAGPRMIGGAPPAGGSAPRSGAPPPPHEGEVSPMYACPLTRELFWDPVITASGIVYERAAIEAWLATRPGVDPMTNTELRAPTLTPVFVLRDACDDIRGRVAPH